MILIVEDNPETGELLRLFLERKGGMQSFICTDGAEVIRSCRAGKIGLVIMDLQLNGTLLDGKPITGVDLIRRLKADPETAGIPVLISTAHAMRDQREQFLRESGAEGYVTKPVENYDHFIAEIRRWLKTGGNASPG